MRTNLKLEHWIEFLKPEVGFRRLERSLEISLERQDVKNSLNRTTIDKLTRLFVWLGEVSNLRESFGEDSPDFPRLVVLRGSGDVFCAGADLKEMRSAAQLTEQQNQADAERLFELFDAAARIALPFCVCAHGAAMGGALGFIATSDFSFATQRTTFCFSEVRLGIAPAVISSFVLSRSSRARVRQLMMTARRFDPEAALQAGLVDQVFSSAQEMAAEVQAMAQALTECSPTALIETKRLCRQPFHLQTSQARKDSIELIARLRAGASGQEGLSAFFENRKPSWADKV